MTEPTAYRRLDPFLNITPKLNAALAAVQAELPALARDRTVEVTQKDGGKYSYSYATLAALTEAVLPILAKHGLAFTSLPGAGSDGKMALRYALLHTSGESLTGEFPISGEGGIQMIGGRITYARRYCLQALVGIAAEEDDDARLEDGGRPVAQRASQPRQAQRPSSAAQGAARVSRAPSSQPALPHEEPADPDAPEGITKAQLGKLQALMREAGVEDREARLAWVAEILGEPVASSTALSKDQASRVIEALQTYVDRESEAAG